METPLDPIAPRHCLCYPPEDPKSCTCTEGLACEGCVCMAGERALHAYLYGHPMPAMTPAQRHYCLDELAHVEGYARQDYEKSTDQDLARGVMNAWIDYSRDQRLL